jgi:phosphatidylserine/phosphatidylglycerophosphate/cardiolipin synthase-like enzyme
MLETLELFFDKGKIDKNKRNEFRMFLESTATDDEKRLRLISDLFEFGEHKINSGSENVEIFEMLSTTVRLLFQLSQSDKAIKTAFSPGDACKEMIINHIFNAKESLDIAVFTISDDEITAEILRAWKRGVEVRIITDNDKSLDEGSDIYLLAKNDIPVKVDNSPRHMHHKFSICDGIYVLTGSYNWTLSAARYNQENIIELENQAIADQFQAEFNLLWENLDEY